MASFVRRLLRGATASANPGETDQARRRTRSERATKRRKDSAPNRSPRPGANPKSSSKKSTTPVVVPPWSYSLREVKEKVKERDGMRRRAVEGGDGEGDGLLVMGDVEGSWVSASLEDRRFLPTAREEERLERMFEKGDERSASGSHRENAENAENAENTENKENRENNPFGRGAYRCRKSMGDARWGAYKEREAQQLTDHVEILEERFGKRFVRESRRHVNSGGRLATTTTTRARQVVPTRRLNVGVSVGQTTRKRPSTAEGTLKQARVGHEEESDGEDGWRIGALAARPLSG